MDFSIEQIEQYSQINDISLCYGASGICLLLSEIDKEKALSNKDCPCFDVKQFLEQNGLQHYT